jgi:glycosyltransferase involved in cell wall biosynthesis
MSLTVLSVGYPFAAVGPDSVGGAEQVMRIVEEAIVRAGHVSLVLAAKGSRCWGSVFEMDVPRGALAEKARDETLVAYRKAIADILSRNHVDVVHMHGVDFARYLPEHGPPLLVTLHVSPSSYPPEIFGLTRPRTHYACVSKRQMGTCPPGSVPIWLVPNGVVLDEFSPARHKLDFALALGRICPEKGLHLALDAAKRASARLLLAGTVFPYPEHVRYFREEIVPRLDDRRVFIGAIGRREKRVLLAQASCVILPSFAEETSSLVAMEALASGTPVIARSVGALRDLIHDGSTGYLVSTVEEMADAIVKASTPNSALCRQVAEQHFSSHAMTARYLELFERLAAPS